MKPNLIMENTFKNAIDFVNKNMPDYLKGGQARQTEIARTLVKYANEVLLQHDVSGSSPNDETIWKEFELITDEDLDKAIQKEKGLRSASGAVDKTVSDGKKLCECYDPFPDENNECRNCNGSTIRA